MNNVFESKRVLITGGTGSLGKTLVKRLLSGEHGNLKKLIIFSRDEAKQHAMRVSYKNLKTATDEVTYNNFNRLLEFRIGDVRSYSDIASAMKDVDIVINAAALKQVPSSEYFPEQALKTNCDGANNITRAISELDLNVHTVVCISTDKACKPVNVMGLTKSIQERIFLSANILNPKTRFIAVRYGNVFASRGSVIPLFHEQISSGGPVTITVPEMTRFLLTLDEAVDLIDWSYHHKNSHGKIAVPKVKSMRVVNVAKSLIKSYGKNTTVEDSTNFIKLKEIGIRSGEKLHEEMISTEEWLRTEDLENYLITSEIVNEDMWSYSSKNSVLTEKETYKFLSESGVIN